ncbi:hypothetical protein FS837_002124 [Tulasnella sp. UAMH 9824]|nr:hypothetical protein FS837_002124 [Tulasnella sp. UAMH 9824]
MSPINTLLLDVFQIITTSCWEEKGEPFALAASHVCRSWRRHVLNMPLLWNRLEFSTKNPQWDKLEAKLERSGQAPLDIIVEEEVFLKSGMPHLRRILRMIVPHVERWRSLRMVDVPHKIRRVFLDQLRGKCVPGPDQVEVVQGRKYDRTIGGRIKSTSRHWDARKVFAGAPNLRHLEWTNPEAEYRLLPSFQNLLTLKVGPGTLDIDAEQFIQLVFRILSASPALQVLSLSHGPDSDWNQDVEDVEHLVQPPATHSSLQMLDIAGRTSIRSAILRSLILPQLRRLGEPIFEAEITTLCCKALLQYIDFGGNNKWLPNLGDCCPRLKSLMFLYCTGYTIKAIRVIVETRMKRDDIESLEELSLYPRSGGLDDASMPIDEELAWFSRLLDFNGNGRSWDEFDGYDL